MYKEDAVLEKQSKWLPKYAHFQLTTELTKESGK